MPLPGLGGSWLLPPRDFSHLNESHPMDHDSNSSGHTSAIGHDTSAAAGHQAAPAVPCRAAGDDLEGLGERNHRRDRERRATQGGVAAREYRANVRKTVARIINNVRSIAQIITN